MDELMVTPVDGCAHVSCLHIIEGGDGTMLVRSICQEVSWMYLRPYGGGDGELHGKPLGDLTDDELLFLLSFASQKVERPGGEAWVN